MNQDNLQFYPTPDELAREAWAMFKDRHFERVLEPSAGEGHLIRAAARDRYNYRCTEIDAIEIDSSRHEHLREEERVNVVGFDFLKFKNGAQYSHIIMNPPFSEGSRHVLHAWDILFDGEIVAILNAETIRNPFSVERKRLAKLIEEHGEVKFVGSAFSDAERATNVDVALVWLKKKADASVINGDWLEDLKQDVKPEHRFHYEELNEIALPNSFVENMVAAFRAAVKATVASIQAQAKANHYSRMLGRTLAEYDVGRSSDESKTSVDYVRNTFRKEFNTLKDRAWAGVLRSTQVTSKTSSKVQRQIESEFENVKMLEFTVENIYGFLLGLVQSKGKIQQDMLLEVFDLITKYHTDNTHFYRGWISNNKHRTAGMRIKTTRFILPGFQIDSWSHSFGHCEMQKLSDIDKVFAMMDGKTEPDTSLAWVFHHKLNELKNGGRLSSSYFDVRLYPGIGTIHFFPRSKELMDRFNRHVGKIRKWLPPEESMASNLYWKHYENSDKYDKEIRSKIAETHRHTGYSHPLSRICSSSDEEKTKAFEAIGAAVDAVLEKHGIDVDSMLAPSTSSLLLEAA